MRFLLVGVIAVIGQGDPILAGVEAHHRTIGYRYQNWHPTLSTPISRRPPQDKSQKVDGGVAPPTAEQSRPMVIWLLWFQGWKQAPPLAHECARSWIRLNPGWTVVLLDEANLSEHVDILLPSERWSLLIRRYPAAASDVVRLHLCAAVPYNSSSTHAFPAGLGNY